MEFLLSLLTDTAPKYLSSFYIFSSHRMIYRYGAGALRLTYFHFLPFSDVLLFQNAKRPRSAAQSEHSEIGPCRFLNLSASN